MCYEDRKEEASNGLIRMLWGVKGKNRRSWWAREQMVIVFTLVCCNESPRIITRSFHVFPCSAICARASIVTSRIRIASYNFLSVFSPPESIFKTVWFHRALWYSCFTWLLLVLPANIILPKSTQPNQISHWRKVKESNIVFAIFYLLLLLLGSSSSPPLLPSSHWLLLQPESEVPLAEFVVDLGTANSNGVTTQSWS